MGTRGEGGERLIRPGARLALAFSLMLILSLLVPQIVSSESEPRVMEVLRVNDPAHNDTDAPYYSAAMSDSGTVHVAWMELNLTAETWGIMYSNLRAGDGLFAQKRALIASPDAAGPSVAIAALGTRIHVAYAVAQGPCCSSSQIVVRTSLDDGVSFGPEVSVPNTTSDFNWRPDLVVGPSGEVYVVWTKAVVGEASWLEVARSSDGGLTFETPVVVNPTHNFTADFDAASDSLGRLHVVWFDVVTPGQTWDDLFYSSADSSLVFSPMRKLDGEMSLWHSMQGPTIALSQGGSRIVVAWSDSRNTPGGLGDYDVFLKESQDSGVSWSPGITASQGPPGSMQFSASLALDEFGRVYLAWADDRDFLMDGSRGSDIYLSRSEDDASFDLWPLDAVNRSSQSSPTLLSYAGFLHLVFVDRSEGRTWGIRPLTDIRYVRLNPPPSGPVVTYSDLTPKSFRASWSRPPDADLSRFEVQLAEPGDGTFTTVFATSDVSVNSTLVAGLQENALYRLRVLAFDDAGGWSSSSVVDVATPNAEPARPILSVASLTPNAVSLRWTRDEAPDFSEYFLEVARSPDFASPIATRRFPDRNATEHLLGGLSERTTYYARLTVGDSHGATNVSEDVVWTTPNEAPEPVRILDYYATGSDSLFLSWEYSYAEDFLAYEVYAFDSPGATGNPVTVVSDRATTSQLVTGLKPGKTYWLTVVVVDSGGLGAGSAQASVATLLPPEDGVGRSTVPLWLVTTGVVAGGIVLALVWWRRRRS